MKLRLQVQLFSFLLICGFFACEEPVELDLDEFVPQVVVNGSFKANHPFQIALTQDRSILTNGPTQFVDNAKVSILNEENKLLGVLNYQKDALLPYYQLEGLQPTTETTYHLSIEVPNYLPILATDRIPKPVALKDITIDTILLGEGEMTPNAISLTTYFSDPSNQSNFYHLRLFYEVVGGRTHSNGFVENKDEHLLPLPIEAILENQPNATFDSDKIGILFSDEHIDGIAVQLKLLTQVYTSEAGVSPKIVGELRSVSENYYTYYTSLAKQQESKDRPFSEPVSVFSNIENGLGIFVGFSTHRDSVTVIQ